MGCVKQDCYHNVICWRKLRHLLPFSLLFFFNHQMPFSVSSHLSSASLSILKSIVASSVLSLSVFLFNPACQIKSDCQVLSTFYKHIINTYTQLKKSTSQNFVYPAPTALDGYLEPDAAAVSPDVVVTVVAGMVCCKVSVVVVVGAEVVQQGCFTSLLHSSNACHTLLSTSNVYEEATTTVLNVSGTSVVSSFLGTYVKSGSSAYVSSGSTWSSAVYL